MTLNYNLIPLDVVKSITGVTNDSIAATQGRAIVGILQDYFGLLMVKQDILNEKVTMPYKFSRIIKPRYAPINSVSYLGLITHEGTYKTDASALAIGEFSIEVLPKFWALYYSNLLPTSISAVEVSYNAGLFSSWEEVPAVLQEAAIELLKYKYNSGFTAGLQSEKLGDYSYTKGNFVNGLPAEIAGMLDGLKL